jgi:hypothetical protein
MRNIRISYYNRQQGKTVTIDLPENTDCLTVLLPPGTDDLPALAVQVNTDAVRIDADPENQRIGGLDFSDLLAEAEAAGEYHPRDTDQE